MQQRMKFFITLFSIGIYFSSTGSAQATPADFSKIHAAHTVEESERYLQERRDLLIDVFLNWDLHPFETGKPLEFYPQALARLIRNQKVDEVLDALLSPDARPYALLGSSFEDIGWVCRRKGDYDFMLTGLVPIANYLKLRTDSKSKQAYTKVLDQLLIARGNQVRTQVSFGICGTRPETENHVLMTESSRYLTNELLHERALREGGNPLPWDNAANGMTAWLLNHLGQFVRTDFSELHSKPYQNYALFAIGNLATYAQDQRVRDAAAIVLDYLAAKYSVQAIDLRRSVPFRRKRKYWYEQNFWTADAESARYTMLTGNFDIFSKLPAGTTPALGHHVMFMAAIQSYLPSADLLGLQLDRDRPAVLQRFHTQSPEIYFSSKNFVLSAGGRYDNRWDLGTGENDVWAVPTTVMPAGESFRRDELIRFDGHSSYSSRSNLCVGRGFVCGLNPVIPTSIPASEKIVHREFVFVRFPEFYVAARKLPCLGTGCAEAGTEFGWMEVRERSEISFDLFVARILRRNEGRPMRADRDSVAWLSDGTKVVFRALPENRDLTGIRTFGGEVWPNDTRSWPLATGDLMEASGDGLVTVRFPGKPQVLRLDMRDPQHPIRQ